jgi:hypothetical protein
VANTEIKIITVTAPIPISLYIINYVVLYIIRKAVDYRTTPKKNEKSLKLNSGLLIEISLANLITDLINDLINTLWTMRMIILT